MTAAPARRLLIHAGTPAFSASAGEQLVSIADGVWTPELAEQCGQLATQVDDIVWIPARDDVSQAMRERLSAQPERFGVVELLRLESPETAFREGVPLAAQCLWEGLQPPLAVAYPSGYWNWGTPEVGSRWPIGEVACLLAHAGPPVMQHVLATSPRAAVVNGERSGLPPLVIPQVPTSAQGLIETIHTVPGEWLAQSGEPAAATAVRAGLLCRHDAFTASHELAQSLEFQGQPRHGDYWHAILHRREPDDSNAQYWFRHVGDHPVFAELFAAAQALFEGSSLLSAAEQSHWAGRLLTARGWDAVAFVDMCSACRNQPATPLGEFARQVQWLEMQLLLRLCASD